MESLKRLLRPLPFYTRLAAARRERLRRLDEDRAVFEWRRSGSPAPPPHVVKRRALVELGRRYGLRTLVETGTCEGDMVAACRPHFDTIYSIELSEEFFARARRRFEGTRGVHLIQGDSGKVLGRVVAQLARPALFWLDGHYSGFETARGEMDTPVVEELGYVLASGLPHVVVIDDARLFGTDPAYPTVEDVRRLAGARYDVTVESDAIRLLPKTPAAA